MISLGINFDDYEANQVWADPDVDHAAMFMNRLRTDKSYYELIAKNAQTYMKENFSPDMIGKLIEKRILEIDQLLSVRLT